jgi:hypothetical protein
VVVAATGPSLTTEIAEACRNEIVLAVNDAWRLLPWASVLYACDEAWWNIHDGCREFRGEKWSSHGGRDHNDKTACARRYGLKLVQGRDGNTFDLSGSHINYGSNSGFQGINLALLMGATKVVLVGFDMRVNGRRHFFGDHPKGLMNSADYVSWVPNFAHAAKHLPAGIEVVNCTPGSALTCFKMMDLSDALSDPPSGGRAHDVAAADRPDAHQDALCG